MEENSDNKVNNSDNSEIQSVRKEFAAPRI